MFNNRQHQTLNRTAAEDYRYTEYDRENYRARNEFGSDEFANTYDKVTDDFDELLYYNAPKKAFDVTNSTTRNLTNENYSLRQNSAARPTETLVREPVRQEPMTKQVEDVATINDESDALPSTRTMQYKNQGSRMMEDFGNIYEENKKSTQESYSINGKTKFLIALYTIVVVAIFALIVLNTTLLGTMNSKIANQEETVAALQEKNYTLQYELKEVSSNAEIERKAAELGMVKD